MDAVSNTASGGGAPARGSSADEILSVYHLPWPLPLWLHPGYARHIVKGNFMTLSARPKTVEQGEWVAHHIVEHYRNLWNFVRVVHEKEEDGTSICNATSCPRMSAGAYVFQSCPSIIAPANPLEITPLRGSMPAANRSNCLPTNT